MKKKEKLAEDLIFNTHSNALSELIAYFENAGPQGITADKKSRCGSFLACRKRANFRIVNRLKDGIQNDVVSAIAEKLGKNDIIKRYEGICLLMPLLKQLMMVQLRLSMKTSSCNERSR